MQPTNRLALFAARPSAALPAEPRRDISQVTAEIQVEWSQLGRVNRKALALLRQRRLAKFAAAALDR